MNSDAKTIVNIIITSLLSIVACIPFTQSKVYL